MVFVLSVIAILVVAFLAYAAFLRHRDAVARHAWEVHCNEQALANNAAHAARRAGVRAELSIE